MGLLKDIFNKATMIAVALGLTIVVGLILAYPVFLLWNWILPSVTKGVIGKLTVWKAWGLTVLIGILFANKGRSG